MRAAKIVNLHIIVAEDKVAPVVWTRVLQHFHKEPNHYKGYLIKILNMFNHLKASSKSDKWETFPAWVKEGVLAKMCFSV